VFELVNPVRTENSKNPIKRKAVLKPMTKTTNQILLDQPAGIQSLVADLTNASSPDSFNLRRCGSLSAIGNTEIGLACGAHAFQTIALSYCDSAAQTLATPAADTLVTEALQPMAEFLELRNTPPSVVRAAGILIAHGFAITAVNQLSTMTTVVLQIGKPARGIRAEVTWL
jgi:hypothetical protein